MYSNTSLTTLLPNFSILIFFKCEYNLYVYNNYIEFFFLVYNLQVLQQCLLRKSWRDQHKRDEFSGIGFLIWIGIPFKCESHNVSYLLLLSSEGDVDAATHSQFSRIFLVHGKIIKNTIILQWRWIIPQTTTATSCLNLSHLSM